MKIKKLLLLLFISVLLTVLFLTGMLKRPDKWVQDQLFQRPSATSGIVTVIGIDEKALSELGAYNTWDRNIMASALEALSSDPDHAPAVVAIDTLYSGETDPEADERLARAAEKLGNVITATSASFGTRTEQKADGSYFINDRAVLEYEEPYPSLLSVTTNGHINAMYDVDGIMRHALLYIEPEEGVRVNSMAWETAALYSEKTGKTLIPPATDRNGAFFVSFTALPGGFYDGVSIADLIAGRVPGDYFDGRIVFIGPYAAGLQDAYFTPIDRAQQMYGVEFQANVVEALLAGAYKTEVPDLLQAAVLFILCLLVGYLLLFKLKLLPSSILSGALIILYLFLTVLLYKLGFLLHVLWIPVSLLVLYLFSIGLRYMVSVTEKRQITRTFERYVAPEIVREILKEGTENLKLGGKHCDIAVLFVDVRGFTTMSERLSPEEVVYILNQYLTMTSECIENNKGTLDKFVGDATMAFWGAPLPVDDGIYLAVKTALDIVNGAKALSAKLKEEIGEELNVGVGVHYGPAVVGNMGAQRHMDYTAIGDTVNTSARLEANAPGGCVYLSRVVVDALEGRIKATSLGDTVKLKGKAAGFEVLKLEELEVQEN
ncbi:MAG: adenylate/guanylate cyclase domain-containing protein [Lachnospiraceae bacterium]|nr:adenylate/guanylate cyclase domain-containing protein [Lachnospiraceae bacterium]